MCGGNISVIISLISAYCAEKQNAFYPFIPKWKANKRNVKLTSESTTPPLCSPHSCPPVIWAARLTSVHQSPPSPTTSTLSWPLLLSRCLRARKSSRIFAPCHYEVSHCKMNTYRMYTWIRQQHKELHLSKDHTISFEYGDDKQQEAGDPNADWRQVQEFKQ